MKKPNYQAWDIKPENFPAGRPLPEQLKFLLGFGVLAPSGHNGQPWAFQISGDKIEIYIEPGRALPKSDPPGKQLSLGIGCLIENLAAAADYFGFSLGEELPCHTSGGRPFAVLTFIKTGNPLPRPDHLIHFIAKRRSNRNRYSAALPTVSFQRELQKLGSSQMQIILSLDRPTNQRIAALVVRSQIAAMESQDFKDELSELMKPNYTKSKIGMPGFVYGLPLPVSIFSSLMIKKLNMSKINAKTDLKLLSNFTPAFAAIAAKTEDKPACVQVGKTLERIWLLATQEGLDCSINAAPTQHEPSRKELQSLLGTPLLPLAFLRIGRAAKAARHSPRLEVSEVLKT